MEQKPKGKPIGPVSWPEPPEQPTDPEDIARNVARYRARGSEVGRPRGDNKRKLEEEYPWDELRDAVPGHPGWMEPCRPPRCLRMPAGKCVRPSVYQTAQQYGMNWHDKEKMAKWARTKWPDGPGLKRTRELVGRETEDPEDVARLCQFLAMKPPKEAGYYAMNRTERIVESKT